MGVNRYTRLSVRGGNAYLLFVRSKPQWGLSTPFGWRLTALKMTENESLAQDYRQLKLAMADKGLTDYCPGRNCGEITNRLGDFLASF